MIHNIIDIQAGLFPDTILKLGTVPDLLCHKAGDVILLDGLGLYLPAPSRERKGRQLAGAHLPLLHTA